MNITIIGTGYVGLVTGACFSNLGHSVICLDINESRIRSLQAGVMPFYEPQLSELLMKGIDQKTIIFSTSYKEACKNSIFFICVDTPDDGNGNPNLSSINATSSMLGENISQNSLVITKSTVPLGTNLALQEVFDSIFQNKDISVRVCSNPEFLKEGSAVHDFMHPDRIIIGTASESAKETLKDIYKPLNKKINKLIFMSVESAELTKYAANSFLATKISFMNEIAQIAEKTGANIHEIRAGIGSDHRIGADFLYAGLGYGGSCFPKDINALIGYENSANMPVSILKAVKELNDKQVDYFFLKIKNYFGDSLSEASFVLWGLSFKPNTDDIRESIAIKLIQLIASKVQTLYLYDPVAMDNAQQELGSIKNIIFSKSKYADLQSANALIICTEWKEFWDPDLQELEKLKNKIIFDGRNILNPSKLAQRSITYKGIGI